MKNQYTIIWMDDALNIRVQAYEGDAPSGAVTAWEKDAQGGSLIGVIEGDPKVYFWQQ